MVRRLGLPLLETRTVRLGKERRRTLSRRLLVAGKEDQTVEKEMVSSKLFSANDDFLRPSSLTFFCVLFIVDPEAPDTSPTKFPANSVNRTPSAPDTPDVTAEPGTSKTATRKSGRPARRGRVGRNQYTRDRDINGGEGNYANGNSPRRGQSRDGANGGSPTGGHTGANGVHLNGGESGKPSRPRHMNPNRTSMNDMRKRVAAILEFISRMQVEMAASGEQATPPNGGGESSTSTGGEASGGKNSSSNSNAVAAAVSLVQGIVGEHSETIVNGDSAEQQQQGGTSQGAEASKTKNFKDLSSVEMMDVLTRDLLKWQQEYGKYGEK